MCFNQSTIFFIPYSTKYSNFDLLNLISAVKFEFLLQPYSSINLKFRTNFGKLTDLNYFILANFLSLRSLHYFCKPNLLLNYQKIDHSAAMELLLLLADLLIYLNFFLLFDSFKFQDLKYFNLIILLPYYSYF